MGQNIALYITNAYISTCIFPVKVTYATVTIIIIINIIIGKEKPVKVI